MAKVRKDAPEGANYIEDTLALIARVRTFNESRAEFHREAADALRRIFWKSGKLAPQLIEEFGITEMLCNDPAKKAEARRDLGRIYRDTGNRELALVWFRKVLEILPRDRISLKQIQFLEANERL